MKIIVVGAGSIGANIAYALASQGAEVVLADRATPAAGTSGASLSWLASFPQLSWKEHPGRAQLRHRVDPSFRELAEKIPGDWLHWSGTLTWGTPAERAPLRHAVDAVQKAGVDVEILTADQVRAAHPGMRIADDSEFIWEPGSGWVDAPGMIRGLVDGVTANGGTLRFGEAVVGLLENANGTSGVQFADGTTLEGDVVVNAAGAWGTHLAALANIPIPMSLAPGLVVYTQPLPDGHMPPVLNAPEWSSRPDPSGGLAVHWRGTGMIPADGNAPRQVGNGTNAQSVIDLVAGSFSSLEGTTPLAARIGIRALPDGGPIVGTLEQNQGLYFALSHGGVGWGPTWGWAAVEEILHGRRVPELEGMRPDRHFAADSKVGRFADDAEQAPIA